MNNTFSSQDQREDVIDSINPSLIPRVPYSPMNLHQVSRPSMSVVQPPLSSDRSMSVMQPFLSGTVTDALSVVVSERPIKVFCWYENEFSYEKHVDADEGSLPSSRLESWFSV